MGFLDERQQLVLQNALQRQKAEFSFFGGTDDAERRVLCVGEASGEEYPIAALTASFKKEYTLSHRDFLGALMALGVKRESIGDIRCGEGLCVFFAHEDIKKYLLENFDKAGKVGLTLTEGVNVPLPVAHSFQSLQKTVASNRLDGVISALLNTSREQAIQMITAGLVTHNHIEASKNTARVDKDDVIAVRGKGKFVIDSIELPTKKGRIRLEARKYV